MRFDAIRFFLYLCKIASLRRYKPETVEHLEANIRRVIAEISPYLLKRVCENWTSRLRFVRASRGGHMPIIMQKNYLSNKANFMDIKKLFYFNLKFL